MASADVDITANPLSHDPSAPNGHGPLRPVIAPLDDLDGFSDLDAEVARALGDVEGNATAQTSTRAAGARSQGVGDGLGLDEEIKVRKPRAPIAKLDENRLLSEKGIPKLRKITKDRLRFKGKGHEFSDIARLLNVYQLWLDDLFPKAKFADALNMIEKLGHKKRMQVWRKEWIEETKPVPRRDELSDGEGEFIIRDGNAMAEDDNGLFEPERRREGPEPQIDAGHLEPSGTGATENVPSETSRLGQAAPAPEDAPEWDELDELFAGEHVQASATSQSTTANDSVPPNDDDFTEEMGILAEMEDPW